MMKGHNAGSAKFFRALALFDEGASRLREDPLKAEAYFREAAQLFEQAAESQSAPPECLADAGASHLNLGIIASLTDRRSVAVSEFERAVTCLEPLAAALPGDRVKVREDLASARRSLALVLASGAEPASRDLARAVALARQNTELLSQDADSWRTLARITLILGSTEPALDALQRSMKLRNGGDSHEWFLLAAAYALKGDRVEARRWYDKAVRWMETKPRDEALIELRSETSRLLGSSR
jgi:tetratricopeptide (TPR) repeat protein